MMVLIGYGQRIKDDIWMGNDICPACGQRTQFRLKRLQQRATVFYIPVMSVTQKRMLVCDRCGAGWEKNRQEYNEMVKQQEARLERGEFDEAVVMQDYAPQKLKIKRKIVALVLTAILAVFMLLGIAAMGTDIASEGYGIDGGSVVLMVILAVVFLLPFVFALRTFLRAKKQEKIYHMYGRRMQLRNMQRKNGGSGMLR